MISVDDLIGVWVSDPKDTVGILAMGRATLEFQEDGNLTYIHHGDSKDEVSLLTYSLEGDCLVTNQPTSPHVEKTLIDLDFDGRLTLELAGQKTRYIRRG